MKWAKLILIFFCCISLFAGNKGGWIEDEKFNNVEAEYIEATDSLATPRAKIDTSWVNIDFNDKDITGVNKITADSGNIAEMWVSESFADSLNTVNIISNSIFNSIVYVTSSSFASYHYLRFNASEDYIFYDFGNIADSIYLDSMELFGLYDLTDAHDTLFWGIVSSTSRIYNTIIKKDTILIDSVGDGSNEFTWKTTVNAGWKGRNNVLELFAHDISNFINIYSIRLWGIKYNKRYGQP